MSKKPQEPYFSVPRHVFDMYFFTDPDKEYTPAEALFFLYAKAQWADGEVFKRGHYIPVKTGQLGWSIKRLAKEWRWSTSRVTRFLNKLENESHIEQRKDTVTTIITMKHYIHPKQSESQNEQRTSHERVTNESQTSTKDKKRKEITERKEITAGAPPLLNVPLPPPLQELMKVPGYKFDLKKDSEFLQGLREEFPEVDAVSLLRGWHAYKIDEPFTKKDKQRSQLRNQFENARKYKLHKKVLGNGNGGSSEPMSEAEAIDAGTFDYEKASKA